MRRVRHSVKPTDSKNQSDGGELVAPVADDVETEGMGEQAEVDAGSEEVRTIPGSRAPRQPTKAEVEDHRRSGCQPPRSWCPFCVGARGVALPHSASGRDHEMPTVSMDYCYRGPRRKTTHADMTGLSSDAKPDWRRRRRMSPRGARQLWSSTIRGRQPYMDSWSGRRDAAETPSCEWWEYSHSLGTGG